MKYWSAIRVSEQHQPRPFFSSLGSVTDLKLKSPESKLTSSGVAKLLLAC